MWWIKEEGADILARDFGRANSDRQVMPMWNFDFRHEEADAVHELIMPVVGSSRSILEALSNRQILNLSASNLSVVEIHMLCILLLPFQIP